MTDRWTVEAITEEKVAKTIDHSLLRPELTLEEALPGWALAAPSQVPPPGPTPPPVKGGEAQPPLGAGAAELDMVLPIGWLRSGEDAYVHDDIAAVVAVARPRGAVVKVILENPSPPKD